MLIIELDAGLKHNAGRFCLSIVTVWNYSRLASCRL
jgi:hypothetical protein